MVFRSQLLLQSRVVVDADLYSKSTLGFLNGKVHIAFYPYLFVQYRLFTCISGNAAHMLQSRDYPFSQSTKGKSELVLRTGLVTGARDEICTLNVK